MISLKIAKSMIIHSHLLATAIQYKERDELGIPVPTSLRDWTYYRNLRGERAPHQLRVKVTAPRTTESVELNITNMTGVLEYTMHELGKYYDHVIEANPTMTTYILGVMYRLDLLNGNEPLYPEGTIVYYSNQYLSYNEDSLIYKVQDSLYAHFRRWCNPNYLITDDKYAEVFMLQIKVMAWYKLEHYRATAINSVNISEDEIEARLSDYGIGIYSGQLSIPVRLWLYKNIEYISHNMGKDSSIDLLTQKLITPSGFILEEFKVRQSIPTYVENRTLPVNAFTDNTVVTEDRETGNIKETIISELHSIELGDGGAEESNTVLIKAIKKGDKSELRTKLLRLTEDVVKLDTLLQAVPYKISALLNILDNSSATQYVIDDLSTSINPTVTRVALLQLVGYILLRLQGIDTNVTEASLVAGASMTNVNKDLLVERYGSLYSGELGDILNIHIPDVVDPISPEVFYKDLTALDFQYLATKSTISNVLVKADIDIIQESLSSETAYDLGVSPGLTLKNEVEGNFEISSYSNEQLLNELSTISQVLLNTPIIDENSNAENIYNILRVLSSYTVRIKLGTNKVDEGVFRANLDIVNGLNMVSLKDVSYNCIGAKTVTDFIAQLDIERLQILNPLTISVTNMPEYTTAAEEYPSDRIVVQQPEITVTHVP